MQTQIDGIVKFSHRNLDIIEARLLACRQQIAQNRSYSQKGHLNASFNSLLPTTHNSLSFPE